MQKRWKPEKSQIVKTRTLVAPDDLWDYARAHPLGAGGLIRSLLEQDRDAREGRFREQTREIALKTPFGFMAVTPRPNGFILHLEDEPVLYYTWEEGQAFPMLGIPCLPDQVMTLCLQSDQKLTFPLKRGQTVFLTTPVETLAAKKAKSTAQSRNKRKDPGSNEDPEPDGSKQASEN